MKKKISSLAALGLALSLVVAPNVSAEEGKIVSNSDTKWWNGESWQNSVEVVPHPAWDRYVDIDGEWIWANNDYMKVLPSEGYNFMKNIEIPEDAYNISATLKITADNVYEVSLNEEFVGKDDHWQSVETYHNLELTPGMNELLIRAENASPEVAKHKNPAGLIYDLEVSYELPKEIQLDVKPDSENNPINLKSKGVLPTAILGSEDLDVNSIDIDSLNLNDASVLKHEVEDINGDGHLDLKAFFKTQDLDLTSSSKEVTITGKDTDGKHLKGSDSIEIKGDKENKKDNKGKRK